MKRLGLTLLLLVACGDNWQGSRDVRQIDAMPMIDGAPPSVSLTLDNKPTVPASYTFVVAYRDGTGPWKVAPTPTADTYTLPVLSSSYAVAWTCISPTLLSREVNLYYFTKAERPSLRLTIPDHCTDRITALVALSGNVSNRPIGSMSAAFGAFSADVANNGDFSINTQPGSHDLVIGHLVVAGGNAVTDTAAVQRGLSITGAAIQNLDYTTAMTTQSASVTAVASGAVQVRTSLVSAGGTRFRFADMTSSPYLTIGLASGLAQTGDVYNLQIRTYASPATAITQDWTAAITGKTFSAPTPLGAVTATVPALAPYPQLKLAWPAYTMSVGYMVFGTQALSSGQCGGAGACTVTWTSNVSPGSVTTAPETQLPDLSAVAGWSTSLAFQAGTAVTGFVSASTSSVGASDFPLSATAPAGSTRTIVATDWAVTP